MPLGSAAPGPATGGSVVSGPPHQRPSGVPGLVWFTRAVLCLAYRQEVTATKWTPPGAILGCGVGAGWGWAWTRGLEKGPSRSTFRYWA